VSNRIKLVDFKIKLKQCWS